MIAQYFPSLLVVLLYERSISCHSEDPLCAIPLWRFFQSHLSSYFLTVPPLCCVCCASLTTNRPLASVYLLCQCDTVCHHSNLLQPSPPTPRGQLFLYFQHNLQTVRQCAATKVCCRIAVWAHSKISQQTGAIIRFHQGCLGAGFCLDAFMTSKLPLVRWSLRL